MGNGGSSGGNGRCNTSAAHAAIAWVKVAMQLLSLGVERNKRCNVTKTVVITETSADTPVMMGGVAETHTVAVAVRPKMVSPRTIIKSQYPQKQRGLGAQEGRRAL